MADTDSVVDIRSRIQQFSNKNVDTNSNNITDGKPNPVPRLKPTNSNNNIKTENNANKLIPHTKPVLPIKPQPTPKPRSPKPVDNKRFDSQFHKQAIEPTSPISPKPPPKPKYDSDSASIDEKVNLKKLTSKNSNQILGNKPKPPVKPIALKTNTISPTNSEKLFLPRKISVDGNPPKPPRGNQRLSKYSYENHEIDNKESIKNSPLNNRTSTLDGLVILKQPPTDNEDESSSSDADDYDSPYEHVSASPKVQHKQLARSKNTYDHPDAAAVTGFMNSLGDSVDNEDYEDPDTIEFHPPTEVTLPKRMQSSESSDDNGDDDNYEEPPEDARLPSKHKEYDSSSDDGNYDMPEDIIPPAIPCHHTLPPQVPYHAQNNLQSSSSDEDIACPDYTDPELALYKPPVPITKIETLRRGSFFTPTDYIPNIESFVPDINEDEEYQDPEMAFATHMSHLNGDTPGTDTLDDDIYSDGQATSVYNCYGRQENDHRNMGVGNMGVGNMGVGNMGVGNMGVGNMGVGNMGMASRMSEMVIVNDENDLMQTKQRRKIGEREEITDFNDYSQSFDIAVSPGVMGRTPKFNRNDRRRRSRQENQCKNIRWNDQNEKMPALQHAAPIVQANILNVYVDSMGPGPDGILRANGINISPAAAFQRCSKCLGAGHKKTTCPN